MLHKKLTHPRSIAVVGGSDNPHHLGGSVLKNLIDQSYPGDLYVVNPNKERVRNMKCFKDVRDLPEVDLAIIAIPSHEVIEAVRVLGREKNTRGFIVYSAGFSELDDEGAIMEKEITSLVDEVGGSLLGPNNIGMVNLHYAGVFTRPIPKMDPQGVDFISGSGATAVFTLEAAHQIGLTFSGLYTVGNSAQNGVEEILEHLDQTYEKESSSRVKLLYIEGIKKPEKFLKHCLSLRRKGCSIAALKSGVTAKGNIAAASHTGAMASPDIFVQTMFEKAGIIRCQSRYELITVGGILQKSDTIGKRIAIITHAGGPGVILTDCLSKNRVDVPTFSEMHQQRMRDILLPGASVKNPIDILATGTPRQLDYLIDYCDQKIDEVDAMVVIFGSPGLGSVRGAYEVIAEKIKSCQKPVFAILPSVVNVEEEIKEFIAEGHIAFYDESLLGEGLAKVIHTEIPREKQPETDLVNLPQIRQLLSGCQNGYLDPVLTFELLSMIGIPVAKQEMISSEEQLRQVAPGLDYPVAQKVTGILHKSDKKGVMLHVHDKDELLKNFRSLMHIEGATGVVVQPMMEGAEVFVGAKKEPGYPPLILCGMGGIYVEILKDISYGMSPLSREEAMNMIAKLNAYKVLRGIRGQQGIALEKYADVIYRVSCLLHEVPEIAVLEINPLMAGHDRIVAVDARIRIQKEDSGLK